ncbi:hypothetical protein [Alteromonas sp. BMJM2]|uniref:hypothetical protein n=1 Tax=Alteromonas sp. BMJM2 TaxID=2954241 RepID=UPI0022B5D3E0|nr:hypothetical protein [Alteromonas sp. BMJM2]
MPDPKQEAIISAALDGKSIKQGLIDKSINGINWRMSSFYYYGRDHYVYGLPTDKTTSQILYSEFVEISLDRLEGSGNYTIESIKSVPPSDAYYVTKYLYNIRNYHRYLLTVVPPDDFASEINSAHDTFVNESKAELVTNTEALLNGVPVDRYRETAVSVDGEPATLCETFTVAHTINYSDTFSEKTKHTFEDHVRDSPVGAPVEYTLNYLTTSRSKYRGIGKVNYQEKVIRFTRYGDGSESPKTTELFPRVELTHDTGPTENTRTFEQSEKFIPDEKPDVLYYIIEYYIQPNNGPKIPKYLFTLDDFAFDPGIEQGAPIQEIVKTSPESDYYPIVPLRKRNRNVLTGIYSDTFQAESTREILTKLDLDADHLVEAIETNEDIDDIDEAMLLTAVAATTQKQAGIKYLIRYFEEVLDLIVTEETSGFSTTPDEIGKHFIHIEEGNIDIKVEFEGISRKTITGRIGKVGTTENVITIDGKNDKWHLREQINKNEYVEIYVVNPKHKNYIYSDGVVTTSLKDVVEDEENKNFIIPLKRSATLKMGSFDLQELYYETTMLVCHAYEKRKLEWYETSGFKFFMIVVSIAVLISTGVEIYSVFAAATTATAGLIAVAKIVLSKYLIALGLEYAVELVGVEVAFIVAIAAFVASGYGGLNNVNLANMNAVQLMQLSSAVTNAISTNIQKDMLEFQSKVTAFQEEAEDLMDELESKKELLSSSKIIDPFHFVDNTPYNDFNETPSSYYFRNMQTNVADLSYASIENFVDINLTLPKPTFN